ncbi:ATP-binding protein [Streptomyces sp. RFCAC02]|uniref:ATP-binding protein n=1 Tax=Streptomyces sp. RFCAC02 TaxID=2499143 RepID=UPI001021BECD|nr:ATP-binding protein [Streptomyces sp. RFCAC02]
MQIPAALVMCLAVGTACAVLFVVLLMRERRRAAAARRRAETTAHRADATDAQLAALQSRLADVQRRERLVVEELVHLPKRLPGLAQAARHPHVRIPSPRHAELKGSEAGTAVEAIMNGITEALVTERLRTDGAAQAAVRGATTTLQTMCYQMQSTVDDLLHKYDDPDLAHVLAGLDYLNEQILRRIQATRVVCGAGAGLVRSKSEIQALTVGASSRIPSYERVRIVSHLKEPVAVVDRAAEPVAVILAELMANAVHHSHGSLAVEVAVHRAHNGAVVTVSDAGIGMNADEYRRARRLLAAEDPIELAELGDPPRCGFAAVGQLCSAYGLSVSVEPSHYAGVKAVLFVPERLLTAPAEKLQPLPIHYAPQTGSPMAPQWGPEPPLSPALTGQAPVAPGPFLGEASAPAPAPAPEPEPEPEPVAESRPEPAAPPPQDPAPEAAPPPTGDLPALPQRRNERRPTWKYRKPIGDAGTTRRPDPDTDPAPDPIPYLRDPEDAASRMGAFQRGTARGRAAVDGPEPESESS